MAGKLKNIIGQKFSMLTIIGFSHMENESSFWHVRCDCGNERVMRIQCIRNKGIVSCGCYAIKEKSQRMHIHGQSRTSLYRRWIDIKIRCTDPNSQKYKYYGAKGIECCAEWEQFLPFYEWAMANGYEQELQIDRINNNGNYSPDNCRFVTSKENINNRGCTVYCEINGIKKPINYWAEKIGISRNTLLHRINLGWENEQLLQPSRRLNKNKLLKEA